MGEPRPGRGQLEELEYDEILELLEDYEPFDIDPSEPVDTNIQNWVTETDYCINLYFLSKNDYTTQYYPFSTKAGWKYDSERDIKVIRRLNEICGDQALSPELYAQIYYQIARLVLFTDFDITPDTVSLINQIVRIASAQDLTEGEQEIRNTLIQSNSFDVIYNLGILLSFGNTETQLPPALPADFDRKKARQTFNKISKKVYSLIERHNSPNNFEAKAYLNVESIVLLAQCRALAPIWTLPEYSYESENLRFNIEKLAQKLPRPDRTELSTTVRMSAMTEVAKVYPLIDPQRDNLSFDAMTEWIFAYLRYDQTREPVCIDLKYYDFGQTNTEIHEQLLTYCAILRSSDIPYEENIYICFNKFVRFYQWDRRPQFPMSELITRTGIIVWYVKTGFDNLLPWANFIQEWKEYRIKSPMQYNHEGKYWLVGHYESEIDSEVNFAITFDHAIAGAIRHLIRTDRRLLTIPEYMHPLETIDIKYADAETIESYKRYIATLWAHIIHAGQIKTLIEHFERRISYRKKGCLDEPLREMIDRILNNEMYGYKDKDGDWISVTPHISDRDRAILEDFKMQYTK